MSQPDGPVWIGADPGGAGAFGLAVLDSRGMSDVDCAADALAWIARRGLTRIDSAGVDAPLWWSAGRSGDRKADQWIRQHHKIASGTVQAANSLRGAALVQGALFVEGLRRQHGSIGVTEAHPKAVRLARGLKGDWSRVCKEYEITGDPKNEHEEDAIMAALAAREGFSGRWPRDLSEHRLPAEQNPKTYWLAPVHYFWPE